jgi:Family of unknown function (DUF5677)
MAQANSVEPDEFLTSAIQGALQKVLHRLVESHIAADMAAHGVVLNETQRVDAARKVLNGTDGKFTLDLDDAQVESFRASNSGALPNELVINFEGLADKPEKLEPAFHTAISATVESSAEHLASALVEHWTKDAPEILAQMRTNQADFENRIHSRWGQALDSLDALIDSSADIGGQLHAKTQATREDDDPILVAMFSLHMRGCQVAREVAALLEAGLADGALARWRTLHELAVTATFINKHGAEIARRFLDHSDMQSYRAAREYQRHCKFLGREPISAADMADLETRKNELIAKYGPEFKFDYGWAIPALPKPNGPDNRRRRGPSFAEIEVAVGLDYVRPFFQTASDNVHARSRGTAFRLSAAWAGSSDVGLELPGRNTAWSLIQVTFELLRQRPTFERLTMIKAIQKLGPPIYRAFDDAAY